MRRCLPTVCGLLMVVLLGGSSCTRKGTTGPAIPPLELAASPEPRAEADFREARAARDAGKSKDAERRFRAFLSKWPRDPLVPFAKLEIGRIELDAGRSREARKQFEQVAQAPEPALAERGRMYAAIAAARLGEQREALQVLRPLVGRTVDPQETALLLSTVASAQEATGDELAALETRDMELSTTALDEAQRNRAQDRVRALVKGLDPALELPRAYELLPHDGYAWPVVARQLLRVSFERGERERVSEIARALRKEGPLDEELASLVLRAERSDSADPLVIGAILPLSGRGREVGEAALHGLLLSASEPGKPRVVYRDDGGDPQRALAALEDLVSLNRAVAIIGPLAAAPSQAVVERAAEIGVPVITLSADASLTERSPVAFRMLAEPREEAESLVRAAQQRGAKKFVLLHPDNGFGQAMNGAFSNALAKRNARLVTSIAYPASASSFVKEAEQLEKLDFDTLVLLDGASKIALVAPTLAAKGLWSVAPGTQPPEGRSVLYVIPAAGFDANLAVNSRRYLQGALFDVPFDAADAPSFVTRYRDMFQAEPNLFSALGTDAYRLVESALATGASTREALAHALTRAQLDDPAATGAGFSETRGPREPGHLKTLLGGAFVRAD